MTSSESQGHSRDGSKGDAISGPSSSSASRPSSSGAGAGTGTGTGTGSSSTNATTTTKRQGSKQPVHIGQYELKQTLGSGSFGKVKLATHSLTGHRVAMKIINRRKISTMDMGGRVKREIQYLKLLRHPHIIKLYEVITTPSDIIMVIEYAGGELFQYIVDRGRMSEDEARRFFQQIICAIEYCHRHKIVHRDLKPENLLLDEYLNVKIGDFGLSNIMTDGDFLKTSCGSPNYAAPEVISGKLYAGPEIDIWSCGVILYVMLCGRLPFDDEYIPTLFKKINGGIYTLPSYLSNEAKHLLSSMLIVDPVKRITIAEIRQLPWFQQNLPSYLRPLPPTPAAEPSGFHFRSTSNNGNDGNDDDGNDSDQAQDIGIVEEEIISELAEKMVSFSIEEVRERLQEPEENQVKVAFHLVRDHKRMIEMSHLDENKEMQGFLAQDPPAWNAGLDGGVSRSTSLRKRYPSGRRSRVTTASQHYTGDSSIATAEESLMSADDTGNMTDEVATEAFGSEDEEAMSMTDEDEMGLFTEDDEMDDINRSHAVNIAILKTSIPGNLTDETPSSEIVPPIPPVNITTTSSKRSRNRWHFGIRSRSPPMEIMLELYRTLQVLGMEWRLKPQDAKVKGDLNLEKGEDDTREEGKQNNDDPNRGEELFFIETRWKVDGIVARMNLQLYRVDETNYLVDFRNVGYVRMQRKQNGQLDSNVVSPTVEENQGEVDQIQIHEALDKAYNMTEKQQQQESLNGQEASKGSNRKSSAMMKDAPQEVIDTAADGRKEICSPFLFLECATRLIIELAGGG